MKWNTTGEVHLFILRAIAVTFVALAVFSIALKGILDPVFQITMPLPPKAVFNVLSAAPLVSAVIAWSPGRRAPDLIDTIVITAIFFPLMAAIHQAFWAAAWGIAALAVVLAARVMHRRSCTT